MRTWRLLCPGGSPCDAGATAGVTAGRCGAAHRPPWSQGTARRRLVDITSIPSEDEAMRLNLFENELATRFAKRFANTALVIDQSPLPASVREHYDEDQVAALVCLVALINAANRLAVIVHQKGGSYEPGMFAALT